MARSAVPTTKALESTAAAKVSRWRVIVNRFVFRAMLFTMGTIAVILYRVLPNKALVWAFARAQARNLARLCGVRVHVRGLENLECGPYVFISNHQSHFDIAILLGYLPGQNRFAAKKELFKEPVLGMVMRTMGMIPIDRNDPASAIERLKRLKGDGHSMIIFPEGTRSEGDQLLPFKKGPFVAAIQSGLPVVPVACKGTADVMPKGGYLSILPGDVELIIMQPIPTADLRYEDRNTLLERSRQLIAEALTE
jgi:1-acyl-sn-glycerol-3-phosphate acyltransferase